MTNRPAWRLTPSQKHEGWLVMLGPHDEEFLALFKQRVPASHREWKPGLRAWLVHESVGHIVAGVIAEMTWEVSKVSPISMASIHEDLGALAEHDLPDSIAIACELREGLDLAAEGLGMGVKSAKIYKIDGDVILLAALGR